MTEQFWNIETVCWHFWVWWLLLFMTDIFLVSLAWNCFEMNCWMSQTSPKRLRLILSLAISLWFSHWFSSLSWLEIHHSWTSTGPTVMNLSNPNQWILLFFAEHIWTVFKQVLQRTTRFSQKEETIWSRSKITKEHFGKVVNDNMTLKRVWSCNHLHFSRWNRFYSGMDTALLRFRATCNWAKCRAEHLSSLVATDVVCYSATVSWIQSSLAIFFMGIVILQSSTHLIALSGHVSTLAHEEGTLYRATGFRISKRSVIEHVQIIFQW